MSLLRSGVKVGVAAAGLWLAACFAPMAEAAGIQYSLTSLGSNAWRYDYTLDNTSPTLSFDEFTIYFDLPNVLSIDSFVAPTGWDPIFIQPDTGLPASGFVDAVRTAGNVPAGSFSGFSAEFHYAPGLTPAAQMFELLLSSTFEVIVSDRTTKVAIITPVPEPETYALMLSGLGVLGWAARRRKAAVARNALVAIAEGAQA